MIGFFGGNLMFFNVKEGKLQIEDTQIDYITFGNGNKSLIMIQGLNTKGIKGAGIGLAFMYQIFAKDYKVYLFDRRPNVWEGITVRDFAKDIASAMDKLSIKNADIGLEYISQTVQRMVTYFSEALGYKIVQYLPGVYKALNSSKNSLSSDDILVQKYFYELCPF